jgi:hypothetical protein
VFLKNSNAINEVAIDNFVKFEGATTIHHNCHMLKDVLSIGITSTLVKGVFHI